tara:strand:+ start:3172 stop:5769 length:2598 start_codon:yes stop_codon:yes gene_type:complete
MSLARTIARRSLFGRPGRSLFALSGIALGVATVIAVVTLDHNTVLGLAGVRRDAKRPDIELRAGAGGGADALRQVEGVSLVSEFFEEDVMITPRVSGDETPPDAERIRLLAADAESLPSFDVWRVERGGALRPGRPEVLLGAALVEELGVDLGDELLLARPRRLGRRECKDGELVLSSAPIDQPESLTVTLVGVLAPEGVARQHLGRVAMVDLALGEAIYAGQTVHKRLWAQRDRAVDPETLESRLASDYSYVLNQGAVIGQAADERAFRIGVRMTGLLALVLGMYVIFHTLSMSLTERVREVGTLHALGSTRAQIGRVFLVEAVALAGAGSLVGLAGGLALARILLAFGITTLGVGKHVPDFLIPWEIVGPLTLAGFTIALMGSIFPLAVLGRTDTAAALRGEEALNKSRVRSGFHVFYAALLAIVLPALYLALVPVLGQRNAELQALMGGAIAFLALLVVLSLVLPGLLAKFCASLAGPAGRRFPLAGRLAVRAMRQAPTRVAAGAVALALVTTGIVGLRGMTGSLRGEVEVWAQEAAIDKVWVKGLPRADAETLSAHLMTYPGVIGVEKGDARKTFAFLVLGADPKYMARYGPLAEDPALVAAMTERRGIIVSRRLARVTPEFEVGKHVPIQRGDGVVENFEILAISDAYGHWSDPDERMYGVIADRWLEKDHCVDTQVLRSIAVRFEPGQADPTVVEAAVRELYPDARGLFLSTGQEVLDFHRSDLRRDFVLFDILLFLTVVLAGLGLVNGQLLAALERAKEIGVLKALGTTRRQIAGTVLLESAVVGLVGGCLGTALGAGLTPAVVLALQTIASLDLPIRTPWLWLVLGPAISVMVALIAGLYPIWRMNRSDAVAAVRTG